MNTHKLAVSAFIEFCFIGKNSMVNFMKAAKLRLLILKNKVVTIIITIIFFNLLKFI